MDRLFIMRAITPLQMRQRMDVAIRDLDSQYGFLVHNGINPQDYIALSHELVLYNVIYGRADFIVNPRDADGNQRRVAVVFSLDDFEPTIRRRGRDIVVEIPMYVPLQRRLLIRMAARENGVEVCSLRPLWRRI